MLFDFLLSSNVVNVVSSLSGISPIAESGDFNWREWVIKVDDNVLKVLREGYCRKEQALWAMDAS